MEEVGVYASSQVDESGFLDSGVHEVACDGGRGVEDALHWGVGEEVALHDLKEPDCVAVEGLWEEDFSVGGEVGLEVGEDWWWRCHASDLKEDLEAH